MRSDGRGKVLVVGWSHADWAELNPLLDAGHLPHLEALIERGAMADLAPVPPALDALLWASIATGHRAHRHGVLVPRARALAAGGPRAGEVSAFRCRPLWEIAAACGLDTAAIGWPSTHPARPPRGGAVVTKGFQPAPADVEATPLTPGSVAPPDLEATLAPLRLLPSEIPADDLRWFLPSEVDASPAYARGLACAVAAISSLHAAATWALGERACDLCMTHYAAPRRFTLLARRASEAAGAAGRAQIEGAITGAYRLLDLMLGRLVELAGPDAAVILCSERGATPDRPGILALAGPPFRADERIYGATTLDVCPTALALLGLPVGADMEGRVLEEAWRRPWIPARIATWEPTLAAPAEGAAGPARTASGDDGATDPGGRRTLALVHLRVGRLAEAEALLRELRAEHPEGPWLAARLAECLLGQGRNAEALAVLDEVPPALRGRADHGLTEARARLQAGDVEAAVARLDVVTAALDDARALAGCGWLYLDAGRRDAAAAAFGRALAIDPAAASALRGQARLASLAGDLAEAALLLRRAVGVRYDDPDAHRELGGALARLGRYDEAVRALEVSIALRPGQAHVHRALATLHQRHVVDVEKAWRHTRLAERLEAREGPPSA